MWKAGHSPGIRLDNGIIDHLNTYLALKQTHPWHFIANIIITCPIFIHSFSKFTLFCVILAFENFIISNHKTNKHTHTQCILSTIPNPNPSFPSKLDDPIMMNESHTQNLNKFVQKLMELFKKKHPHMNDESTIKKVNANIKQEKKQERKEQEQCEDGKNASFIWRRKKYAVSAGEIPFFPQNHAMAGGKRDS